MEQDGMSRRQKRYQRQLKADVEKLLADGPARRVLAHVLETCGVYRTSFTGNSTTFYNEGRRAVGLELLDMLTNVDPLAHAALLAEAATRVKNEERTTQKEEQNDD